LYRRRAEIDLGGYGSNRGGKNTFPEIGQVDVPATGKYTWAKGVGNKYLSLDTLQSQLLKRQPKNI